MGFYWIIMVIFVFIALIATLTIANSKANKEAFANRSYFYGVRTKLFKLTMFYVGLTVAIGAVILFVYMYYR